MTQTKQNSAVRTRDEQEIINKISLAMQPIWQRDPSESALNYFDSLASIAFDTYRSEARGAEEQRRKDAEGQKPVAWNYYDEEDDDGRGGWRYSSSKPSSLYEDVHPLYDRPANVATLEARVKVLEAALKKADEFITNGIEFGFIRMPDSDTPDSALDTPGIIRAALTREGGE